MHLLSNANSFAACWMLLNNVSFPQCRKHKTLWLCHGFWQTFQAFDCIMIQSVSEYIYVLKPQDSFGEFERRKKILQRVLEIIRKHHQTFLQLFLMTYLMHYCPMANYHYVHNLWQSVRGDSKHFVLVISWKWKHFGANC